jgi:hypothetical protein
MQMRLFQGLWLWGSTDLEAVYKQIAFDNVYEDAKAVREIRLKRFRNEQVRTIQAKRQASVVSGGTTSLVLMYRQNQLHHCEKHLRLQSVNMLNA